MCVGCVGWGGGGRGEEGGAGAEGVGGTKLSFWMSAHFVLIVVQFKYALLFLWCLGQKGLGNCIDS